MQGLVKDMELPHYHPGDVMEMSIFSLTVAMEVVVHAITMKMLELAAKGKKYTVWF